MSARVDLQDVRRTAQEIVQRAKSDPDFIQQVKAAPEQTLVAAGLPAGVLPDFLTEQGYQAEVSGYARCTESCVDLTCIVSLCPASCVFWTRNECVISFSPV
jgi:hypothetical protein